MNRSCFPVGQECPTHTASAKAGAFLFCLSPPSLPKCRPMEISYLLSEKDFVEAFGVHRNRTAFKKWSMRFFIAFIVLMAVVVVAGALVDHSQQAAKNLLPFAGLLTFLDPRPVGLSPLEHASPVSQSAGSARPANGDVRC